MVSCERSCHGSEDGFLVKRGVKLRAMAVGFLSGDEEAKTRRQSRIKVQKKRTEAEEEEAMDFCIQSETSCFIEWFVPFGLFYKATTDGDNGSNGIECDYV